MKKISLVDKSGSQNIASSSSNFSFRLAKVSDQYMASNQLSKEKILKICYVYVMYRYVKSTDLKVLACNLQAGGGGSDCKFLQMDPSNLGQRTFIFFRYNGSLFQGFLIDTTKTKTRIFSPVVGFFLRISPGKYYFHTEKVMQQNFICCTKHFDISLS